MPSLCVYTLYLVPRPPTSDMKFVLPASTTWVLMSPQKGRTLSGTWDKLPIVLVLGGIVLRGTGEIIKEVRTGV